MTDEIRMQLNGIIITINDIQSRYDRGAADAIRFKKLLSKGGSLAKLILGGTNDAEIEKEVFASLLRREFQSAADVNRLFHGNWLSRRFTINQ